MVLVALALVAVLGCLFAFVIVGAVVRQILEGCRWGERKR